MTSDILQLAIKQEANKDSSESLSSHSFVSESEENKEEGFLGR